MTGNDPVARLEAEGTWTQEQDAADTAGR